MLNIFTYLNGKKTMIGAALLFVAAFFDVVVIGEWGVSADWVKHTVFTLEWIGMPLTGVGFSHKGYKFFQK